MNRSAARRSLINIIQTFRFSLSFLTKEDQRKYLLGISLNIILNLLDVLGIFLLGLFGTLAIKGIQSQPQGNTVDEILRWLGLNNFSFQVQAFSISSSAVLVLTSKSYLSLTLNRKIFNFLAVRSARVSTEIFKEAYLRDLQFINRMSFQELRHSTNFAIYSLVSGILGAVAILAADLILLIFLCVAIGIFDLFSLFFIFIFFSASALLLLRKQFSKAKRIGTESTNFSIAADGLLYDSINLYREFYVRNKREEIISQLRNLKEAQAKITGEQSFLPNIGKYIIESTVMIGIIVVSGLQFILHDANHAVAGVAIFISSASRIAPALMRIQQNLTQMSINMGETHRVKTLIAKLKESDNKQLPVDSVEDLSLGSTEIVIKDLKFKFSDTSEFEINIEKLVIKDNSTVALIGPSGAGKTSLVDLILGVLPSQLGSVTIGGLQPGRAIKNNPNLVSYVPQRVQLLNTSVYENIVLTKEINQDFESKVEEVLRKADLLDWVKSLPKGLYTVIGTAGVIPSGGQTQRLGIARALFTNPKIIILDEATSALDHESEDQISKTLEKLKGRATIVTIAHRIPTIKNSDLIVVIKNGAVVEQGSFEALSTSSQYFQQILVGLITQTVTVDDESK